MKSWITVAELRAKLAAANENDLVWVSKAEGDEGYFSSYDIQMVQVEGHPAGGVVLHIARSANEAAASPGSA